MDYGETIRALTAKEMAAAKDAKDADRIGAAIEGLSRALGFSIAVATNGDAKGIDTMIEGATAYAHGEAVEKSRFAKLFEGLATPHHQTGR